ncbi:hypothetical protein [Bradyrhizobium yuanmingense]|uniref:Uncharacterized protein n=1 Tax=Bradyrhizobium yuanmingense TaxID=108015 RepID=A0ABV4GGN4_9BRAD|nr:hypothetical protein [Bradyrhizobium yuanmingense]
MHDLQSRPSSNNHHILCAFGLADGADQARHLFVWREVKGERLSILVMCARACGNAGLCIPVCKTARPAADRRRHRAVRGDADRRNAYICAVQYQRMVNPVSGAVALGTLLAAVTLPVVVWVVAR